MVSTVSGNSNNIFQRGQSMHMRAAVLDEEAALDKSFLARIVGGSTADPTLYPFYAYFEIVKTDGGTQGTFICGGSLVAPDIVLSAGHCFYGDIQNVVVIVNNTNFNEFTGYEYDRTVLSFKVHPNYIHETYTNDLAIVVLDSPVTEVTPVSLNTELTTPTDGADVQVIGMGFTREVGPNDDTTPFPDVLQMTELQVVPTETCSNEYANAGENAVDGEVNICAYATGKDSCQGDSGGPLLQLVGDTFIQIGVVSYGKGCAKEVSCRYRILKSFYFLVQYPKSNSWLKGFPGVYARVSAYMDFIQSEICGSSQSSPAFCNPNVAPTNAPQQNATDAPVLAPTTETPAPLEMPTVAPSQVPNETPSLIPGAVPTDSTKSPVISPMVVTQ